MDIIREPLGIITMSNRGNDWWARRMDGTGRIITGWGSRRDLAIRDLRKQEKAHRANWEIAVATGKRTR